MGISNIFNAASWITCRRHLMLGFVEGGVKQFSAAGSWRQGYLFQGFEELYSSDSCLIAAVAGFILLWSKGIKMFLVSFSLRWENSWKSADEVEEHLNLFSLKWLECSSQKVRAWKPESIDWMFWENFWHKGWTADVAVGIGGRCWMLVTFFFVWDCCTLCTNC